MSYFVIKRAVYAILLCSEDVCLNNDEQNLDWRRSLGLPNEKPLLSKQQVNWLCSRLWFVGKQQLKLQVHLIRKFGKTRLKLREGSYKVP